MDSRETPTVIEDLFIFDDEEHTDIDHGITTEEILRKVVSRITYAPSCIDLEWDFETKPVYERDNGDAEGDVVGSSYHLMGWLIRTTFKRPDTNTGKLGRGHGRWELVHFGCSSDSAIKTCWVLLDMIVKHELMEMFEVDGKRIFNPHKSIRDLKDR